MKKEIKLTKLLFIIFSICLLLVILYFLLIGTKTDFFRIHFLHKGLEIKSIECFSNNGEAYLDIGTYDLMVDKPLWCIATDEEQVPQFNDEWQLVRDNSCKLQVDQNDKYIYIRDEKNVGEKYLITDYASIITKIETDKQSIELIKDEKYTINLDISYVGNPDKTLIFKSENEDVAKIEGNDIIGVGDGKTKIVIKDKYQNTCEIEVQVTTLITLPQINNSKPFLKNIKYTAEEAKILDEYLFKEVKEAGDGTRAGVVAAARFLTLQFKYRIPYFLENGRLEHQNHSYADGEGRYYHKGLYLSADKFKNIEKSSAGPAIWGTYIKEYSTDNGMMPNGLDCSGFVCWCLKNGGFDFGDIGAGPGGSYLTLAEVGKSQRITMDLLNSKKVKAGDLIGFNGHMGIIIGVTNEKIYVADTLYYTKGTWAQGYTYQELVKSNFTHIYDMNEAYGNDGNYTNMW